MQEWDPSIPGLAMCDRSESEVSRWVEEAAAQRILLSTPSVLVGERVSVYRVEGTTQWYSAFIIGHNQETKVCLLCFPLLWLTAILKCFLLLYRTSYLNIFPPLQLETKLNFFIQFIL